jgi:hypothetical protein
MLIYVMVVHKPSGHGFALSRNYSVVFNRVENAAGWVKDAQAGGLVEQDEDWEGWCPSTLALPDWAAGFPAEDFHAYWFAGNRGEGIEAHEHP